MEFLNEGGLNHPVATLIILALFILCSIILSLFRAERGKSISATEMHGIDRWTFFLGGCCLLLLATLVIVIMS